jgi:AraC family transcriptional regulator
VSRHSIQDSPFSAPTRAGPFLVRRVAYAPHRTMSAHAHEQGSVTLVLAGAIRETVGRTEEIAGPLSVVVKPAGVVHADAFGPRGAATLQVVVEARELDLEGWMTEWTWHHAGAGVRALVALAHALDCGPEGAPLPPGPPEALESRIWDALATLAPGHASGSAQNGRTSRTPAPRWLKRVRERIDDEVDAAPEVRELAGAARVHPVSLARAFRRHFGVSVTGYRSRVRLRRATDLLASGTLSISSAAHAAGFADHAHFCRTFRSLTGVTPSAYRRLAGHAPGAAEPTPAGEIPSRV